MMTHCVTLLRLVLSWDNFLNKGNECHSFFLIIITFWVSLPVNGNSVKLSSLFPFHFLHFAPNLDQGVYWFLTVLMNFYMYFTTISDVILNKCVSVCLCDCRWFFWFLYLWFGSIKTVALSMSSNPFSSSLFPTHICKSIAHIKSSCKAISVCAGVMIVIFAVGT